VHAMHCPALQIGLVQANPLFDQFPLVSQAWG
jgi:hypothetical protein